MSWFKRLLGLEAHEQRQEAIKAILERNAPKPRPLQKAAPAFPPPDGDYRFIAIDVETACKTMRSICQLGIATVDQTGEIRTYSTLIDPECRFSPKFTAIHGIDAKAVRGAPDLYSVFDPLLPLLGRHALIQHSTFDQRAINSAYSMHFDRPLCLRWHNSVTIAQRAWPEFAGAGGHGLSHLKSALKLDFCHHDAGEDARAAAQVVLLAEERLGIPLEELFAARTPRRAPPAPTSLDGAGGGPFAGQIAVFTGTLAMSRADAAKRAAAAGITVRPGVTRQTTLVVVGDQDLTLLAGHTKSTKHRKAEELIAAGHPIRIIGEAEFLALIGAG